MQKYHVQSTTLSQRTVLIVDDGIATGNTMRYAIEVIRLEKPRCIVIVSPVASMEAVRMLRPLVEDLIVLHTPHDLGAIGEWYESFEEVSDEDVLHILSVGLHHEHEPMGRTLRR
jgi:putative phosphoribosyl transferase